jgi:hypothetical protein
VKRKKHIDVKATGAEEAAQLILKSVMDRSSINDENYSRFNSSLGFGTERSLK